MKTIFDQTVRNELTNRIGKLSPESKAQWGKMNVYQMTKHCNRWNNWVLDKEDYADYTYKQDFIGKIFGKWALKSNTKNEKPIGKNMPAGKAFTINDIEGDVEAQKIKWVQLIADYEDFSNPGFVHDFFGKMSKEQIGIFAYKHFDHHLRQFGA